MREGKITTACERGVNEHAGEFPPDLLLPESPRAPGDGSRGRILRKSVIDFGDQPVPDAPASCRRLIQTINRLRRYWSPILVIRPSLALPPVEFWRGI